MFYGNLSPEPRKRALRYLSPGVVPLCLFDYIIDEYIIYIFSFSCLEVDTAIWMCPESVKRLGVLNVRWRTRSNVVD